MTAAIPHLTIGTLAKATGCKVETIRYYERIGLLAPPARSRGGHRHYGDEALKRLNFIRRARRLGFGLDAVRALLVMADGEEQNCAKAERIAAAHLDDVRAKLADLERMQSVLAAMVAACAGGTTPACPVIEALYDRGATGGCPPDSKCGGRPRDPRGPIAAGRHVDNR